MSMVKRILMLVLVLSGILLVVVYIVFTAGVLLSGTRWEIPSHGWLEEIASLSGAVGMALAALSGIPLALHDIFWKDRHDRGR